MRCLITVIIQFFSGICIPIGNENGLYIEMNDSEKDLGIAVDVDPIMDKINIAERNFKVFLKASKNIGLELM